MFLTCENIPRKCVPNDSFFSESEWRPVDSITIEIDLTVNVCLRYYSFLRKRIAIETNARNKVLTLIPPINL
jgi:hypothetical protein